MLSEITAREALELRMEGKQVFGITAEALVEALKEKSVALGAFDLDTILGGKLHMFVMAEEAQEAEPENADTATGEPEPTVKALKKEKKEKIHKTEPDEETLRMLYVSSRWSAKRIADKYDMDVSKVFGLIKKYGIARPAGADDPVEKNMQE